MNIGQRDALALTVPQRFTRPSFSPKFPVSLLLDWSLRSPVCRGKGMMNKLSIIVPILAGIGLTSSRTDTTVQAVVTVTQRFDPIVRTPVGQPQRTIAAPSDRPYLVRELQRELKQVGCYLRDINGIWTTSTRDAMKAFIERVNARLPVDEPDAILLASPGARVSGESLRQSLSCGPRIGR
jgi:hypothetical protein